MDPESHDPVVDLVAECLALLDEAAAPAADVVAAFCAEHAEHAPAIRERVARLAETGLAGGREAPRRSFGRFEILRELGRGGMGVVYLARDPRLGRDVALKALAPRPLPGERARRRFEREIQAIAALKHPRIVPVFEVGEENGIPYFTMEYVEGRTLAQVIASLRDLELRTDELGTTHLSRATFFQVDSPPPDGRAADPPTPTPVTPRPVAHAADLPEVWGRTYVETVCRFVQDVAQALEHAHARGVVHRDVKPSNVLIDGRGRALLFDFGLAHVEDADPLTRTGDFAGTPFYVAPELISGKGRGVDGRADVYGLGVTLFELLTLQRPFQGTNTQAVFRQVLGKEPPLLRRLNRMIPRDLETICLAALEKDPDRRYASAAELAADLRRFLEFRPIKARPISAATRALRWTKRNPAAATAALLAGVLVLGTPTALALHNASLADEARRTAQQATKAASINAFLLDVLGSSHPAELGYDATLRDAVELAVERTSELEDPEVEAGVRATIGGTYLAIGDLASAEQELRTALDLRRGLLGEEHPEVAETRRALAACMRRAGRLAEAEELASTALLHLRRAHGEDHDAVAEGLAECARIATGRGDHDLARGLLQDSLDVRRRLHGEESASVADGLVDLADGMAAQARSLPEEERDWAEVEALYRGGLAMQVRVRGAGHPDVAACRERLGAVLSDGGDHAGAAALHTANVETRLARFGTGHPLVARSRTALADCLVRQGLEDEAEELALSALGHQRRELPSGHLDIAKTLEVLAHARVELGRPEEASDLLEESVAIREARLGLDHPLVLTTRRGLAMALHRQGRLEETLAVSRAALSRFEARTPAELLEIATLRNLAGLSLFGLGLGDAARDDLEAALRVTEEVAGPRAGVSLTFRADLATYLHLRREWAASARVHAPLIATHRALGTLEGAWAVGILAHYSEALAQTGRAAEAMEVAREAIRRAEAEPRGLIDERVDCLLRIGRILAQEGRDAEALTPLGDGVHLGLETRMDQRPVLDASRLYGVCLTRLGRYEEAEKCLVETLEAQDVLLGVQHPHVRRTLADVLELYRRWGRPEEVIAFASRFEISGVLADAGSPPHFGSARDAGYGYGDAD